MAQRNQPPFRADHVGSLLKPKALIEAHKARVAKTITMDEFHKIEHDSIREVVKLQEDLGLKVITEDGFESLTPFDF